jgi:hypothetical protein
MTIDEVLEALKGYYQEIDEILSRFTKTRDAISIDRDDDYRLKELTTEVIDLISDHIPNSVQHARMVAQAYNDGYSGYYSCQSWKGTKDIQGIIKSLIVRIERNPALFVPKEGTVSAPSEELNKISGIEIIITRFHAVARQLRNRYGRRDTLEVEDEYDVQDLFHSLLTLYFNDIRPEEWAPSYAGGCSRVDFLLPEIDTVIEVKKTRPSMTTKDLGEQLIVDIAKYRKHPGCKKLVCFVYDPEGRVANPGGLESDLSNCDETIQVQTVIVPKHL